MFAKPIPNSGLRSPNIQMARKQYLWTILCHLISNAIIQDPHSGKNWTERFTILLSDECLPNLSSSHSPCDRSEMFWKNVAQRKSRKRKNGVPSQNGCLSFSPPKILFSQKERSFSPCLNSGAGDIRHSPAALTNEANDYSRKGFFELFSD